MRSPARLVPVAAACLVALSVNPVLAAGRGPAGPSPGLERTRDAAVARVAEARSLLATGSLADAVRAASGMVGVDVRMPSVGSVPAIPDVPAALAAPVGNLLAAIDTAAQLERGAVHADPATAKRIMARHTRLLARMMDPSASPAAAHRAARALGRLETKAEKLVDRPTLHAGALLLAAAVDAALPAMRAYAATLPATPRTDEESNPCDLVNAGPETLCISSEVANRYTKDYELVIDLGGNDVYNNSAGGGNAIGYGVPVSIVLDLGGDDTYVPVDMRNAWGAEGAGINGYGMLVDAAGDDAYRASYDGKQSNVVTAQGVGALGVGILADLGGSDTYSATESSSMFNIQTAAQGYATLGGLGIMIDRGGSDDSYLLHTHGPSWLDESGDRHVTWGQPRGYGWAVLGAAAIWNDDGGTDTVDALADADSVAPDDSTPIVSPSEQSVQGFGMSATGAAALAVAGSGDTSYSAIAETGRAPQVRSSQIQAFGQGGGPGQGLGAMYDEGGNDTYLMRAVSTAEATVPAADGNGGEVDAGTLGAGFYGQGEGAFGGVGILIDGAGNDAYTAHTETSAHAVATELTGGTNAVAYAENSANFAQGEGGDGAGFLIDRSGDDAYTSEVSITATAEASAATPDAPVEAHATAQYPFSWVQAASSLAGYGGLWDFGGNDRYTSNVSSTATASPATEVVQRNGSASVQGSVSQSEAILLDDSGGAGDTDTFASTPPDPACQGTRGQDTWVDCGQGAGIGINR